MSSKNDGTTLILVDEDDNEVGLANKLDAHQHGGQLHRAFSIFIFNNRNELLIQRRALSKYHFAGLWSNSCCSHARPGMPLVACAKLRLQEELGIQTQLVPLFTFMYRADDEASGLTEHEFDHVFSGRYDDSIEPSSIEIAEWKWISMPDLKANMQANPEQFTPWFRIALDLL